MKVNQDLDLWRTVQTFGRRLERLEGTLEKVLQALAASHGQEQALEALEELARGREQEQVHIPTNPIPPTAPKQTAPTPLRPFIVTPFSLEGREKSAIREALVKVAQGECIAIDASPLGREREDLRYLIHYYAKTLGLEGQISVRRDKEKPSLYTVRLRERKKQVSYGVAVTQNLPPFWQNLDWNPLLGKTYMVKSGGGFAKAAKEQATLRQEEANNLGLPYDVWYPGDIYIAIARRAPNQAPGEAMRQAQQDIDQEGGITQLLASLTSRFQPNSESQNES